MEENDISKNYDDAPPDWGLVTVNREFSCDDDGYYLTQGQVVYYDDDEWICPYLEGKCPACCEEGYEAELKCEEGEMGAIVYTRPMLDPETTIDTIPYYDLRPATEEEVLAWRKAFSPAKRSHPGIAKQVRINDHRSAGE